MNSKQFPNHSDESGRSVISEVNEEVDLLKLLGVIWKGKIIIIICAIVLGGIAAAITLTMPNIYKSDVILAVSENSSDNNLSSLGGQFGGLATIAGVNLGQNSSSKSTLALEILKSRQFIKEFVEKYEIAPELLALKSWSKESGIVYDEDIYDSNEKKWRAQGPYNEPKSRSWQYVKKFKNEHLQVTQDSSSGLVTLSIYSKSPKLAEKWANLLVSEINSTMRERDIKEAKRSLQFLQDELGRTSLSNMKNVFYQLVEKQTQKIMLANVRPEYIFQVIDPAVVALQKSKPNRALIAIAFSFLGGAIGIVIVLVRSALKKDVKPLSE